MRQLLNVYRYVKLVEQRADRLDTENANKGLVEVMDNIWPKITDVSVAYKKKYQVGTNRVNGVLEDARNWEYVSTRSERILKKIDLPKYVLVTPKGRELTDSFFYIPWGLLRAWGQQYGATISLLFTLGLGIMLALLTGLTKELFLYIIGKR